MCPVCGADINLDYKPVKSLFDLWRDEGSTSPPINTATRVLTGRLIKKFGYEAVREAFIQAGINKERQRLEYVRGILIKKNQQQKARESILAAEDLKRITSRPELQTEILNIVSKSGEVDEEIRDS